MNKSQIIRRNLAGVAAICALALIASGCAARVTPKGQTTATGVNLSGNNYKMVKMGASGSSSGFKFLGIIPFARPKYEVAKRELYDSIGESLTGRSVALANETEDRSTFYLILFSLPKLTITADVVEFIDKPKAQ